MIGRDASLQTLQRHFLATSTVSMPIAGTLYWSVVAVLSFILPLGQLAYVVLFGSGMIFPLATLIDRARGRRITAAGTANPVMVLFLRSLVLIVLMWPLVIFAARVAHDPLVIILGGAILMALVWIPYGWAANDPVGMEHAIGRSVASYVAYALVPAPWTASAIAGVVILAYAYSFVRMRRPDPRDLALTTPAAVG